MASNVKPVVKEHSLEVTNDTMEAISEIRPQRFMGILSADRKKKWQVPKVDDDTDYMNNVWAGHG